MCCIWKNSFNGKLKLNLFIFILTFYFNLPLFIYFDDLYFKMFKNITKYFLLILKLYTIYIIYINLFAYPIFILLIILPLFQNIYVFLLTLCAIKFI